MKTMTARQATQAALAGTLLTLICAPLAALAGTPTTHSRQTAGQGITFATPVAPVHGSLPLFRLQHIAAPTSFVEGVLGKSRPFGVENSLLVARDSTHVAQAYVDGRSGEAQIFPDLTAPAAAATSGVSLEGTAKAIFARPDIIPKDATEIRMGEATPVFSAKAGHSDDGKTQPKSAPQKLFTYMSIARFAHGLPVLGDGSQATVAIAGDGSIRGFVRRWQAATLAGSVAATASATEITQAIDAQLQPLLNANTSITVDSVKPAYFDGNAKFMQPVYVFSATLHPRGAKGSDDHVRGYVPVGRLVEPLPRIGERNGSAPVAPQPGKGQPDVSQINLGEYANRDGTMQDMANAYLNGFDSVTPWQYGPPIVRTQWYWAYPNQVNSPSPLLNTVHVAYTMPHGDWYLNTTYSNYADLWYINQIGVNGNRGFGAAAGGQLATWIIDSCEVAPSFYDLQVTTGNGYNAFNPWWPVFQGLHRVLGFRTEMLLNQDTMNYRIAQNMAIGANAVSAFYNNVGAVNFGTYYDSHINQYVHFDRVSTFSDPRNANESIYSVQGQSASGQLTNVWMNN